PPQSPARGAAEGQAQAPPAAHAHGFPDRGLGGIGKSGQGIGYHQQKGDQHGIGGQNNVPLAGALGGKKRQHQQQGNGPDHDVAVHLQNRQIVGQLADQGPG